MTKADLGAASEYDLSTVVISLLKGVIYQDGDVGRWIALRDNRSGKNVRQEYVSFELLLKAVVSA